MAFTGFDQRDFDVFSIDGLEPRMAALQLTVRPKLTALGEKLAPALSDMTGQEIVAHVARHARRSVNPPDDTWVAFAADKRGYKKHPHFQIGLWRTHLFVWFALIYEAQDKRDFAAKALRESDMILKHIPSHFVWSTDHTAPHTIPHTQMNQEHLQQVLHKLQDVKKAELLCGINVDRHDPLLQNGQALTKTIENTFHTLLPLYRMAHLEPAYK